MSDQQDSPEQSPQMDKATLQDLQNKVKELQEASPDQIEKLGEAKGPKDPLDAYAQFFYLYSPRMKSTMNLMSKKALLRLIYSLIQYPLNDKDIKLREKIEQDAFFTADQLLLAKYTMMFQTYLEEAAKQQNNTGQKSESVVESEIEKMVKQNQEDFGASDE